MLVQLCIPRDKSPSLRIVVPRADVKEPRVPIIPVSAVGCEFVRIAGRASRCDGCAEAFEGDCARYGLAGVGYSPLGAEAVEHWVFAVLPDQAVAVSISGGEAAALLFGEDSARAVVEHRRGAPVGPAVS